jgi:Fur family ferric uptake transcriptional regulator
MKKTQTQMLKDHRLRRTSSRSAILGLFQRSALALSHADIEKNLASAYDRVTVYRTLKAFVDKGVLHRIPDDGGAPKYALCNEDCTITQHQHEHVHFKCNRCGETNCIEGVAIPAVRLPDGYQPIESSLLVQGVCNRCGVRT